MLTATQIHNQTDRIAALIALDLAGFNSELVGATNSPLFDLVDAVGDPDYESVMSPYALAIDRQSLPENYRVALKDIIRRPGYRNFAQKLSQHVQSAAGGSYSGVRAWLTAAGATVHPLFAELMRDALNREDMFTLSGDVTTVFSPVYSSRAPTRLYTGQDGSLTDDTTDATDAGTADVPLFAADDDVEYVGDPRKFTQVVHGLSTLASADCDLLVEYWNGSAWAAVSLTDNSTGLTKNDTLKFTLPSDWVRTNLDKGGNPFPGEDTPLYYLRLQRRANTVVTPPVATSIRIIPEAITDANGLHLPVAQPPVALIRVTGAGALTVESLNTIAFARWAEPGIYFRALTPMSNSPVITLAYVDQDGNNASKAQSAWSTPAALAEVAVTLDTGDTGIRSVRTTGNSVSSGAQAVIEVFVAEARTPAL